MSRKVMTPAARRRAQRRALRAEIVRLMKLAEQGLTELDRLRQPTMGAHPAVVIEGRIVDGKSITD
jgi:hypothetical protein